MCAPALNKIIYSYLRVIRRASEWLVARERRERRSVTERGCAKRRARREVASERCVVGEEGDICQVTTRYDQSTLKTLYLIGATITVSKKSDYRIVS